MASQIHSTAIVSSKAQLGENVRIDAYAIIEDDVIIGDNTHMLMEPELVRIVKSSRVL
jgi:acyl-[acyl carrier protein]--UDP-N-acetylglucosamine O-acyltransferase